MRKRTGRGRKSNRLLIVSNRLPVTVGFQHGELVFNPSAGGLASGLASYLQSTGDGNPRESLWIGWPGADVPRELEKQVKQTLAHDYARSRCSSKAK